jgi:aspartyl-tRNA synthetase
VDGITQLVFNPEVDPQAHTVAYELRSEFVIKVTGEVAQRPAGTEIRTFLPRYRGAGA